MRMRSVAVSAVFYAAFCVFAGAAFAQTFVVDKVVRFEQLSGQPQWANVALERLRGARWDFGQNGQFSYTSPNSATGTLRGTYVVKGQKLEFKASGGYQMGYTAATQSAVSGVIDFGQTPPVLTMVQQTGSVMSANVNGTKFGANNGSAYRSVVILQKRRR